MLFRLVVVGLIAALPIASGAQVRVQPPIAQSAQPSFVAGFETTKLGDGTDIALWYPSQSEARDMQFGLYGQRVAPGAPIVAGRFPLVVISHGSGGDFTNHLDTAQALARAGYIVAALTHPGDNWRDRSAATNVSARPKALSDVISFMTKEWHSRDQIDASRIGAFGFSSGGFTVLAAAGGRPDLSRIASHCAEHPAFYVCQLVRERSPRAPEPWTASKDKRIKAIVIVAPALGFSFKRSGLKNVRIPVQLWHAADDHIVPAPFYAHAIKAALPLPPEFHVVPGAGHFDFMAPCANPTTVPQICSSAADFDRAEFHRTFNEAVLMFFANQM